MARDSHAAKYSVLDDAALLKRHAEGTGLPIPDTVLRTVVEAEQAAEEGRPLSLDQQVALEGANRELAALVAPITAATLRATSDAFGARHRFLAPMQAIGPARLFARKLWIWTVAFLLLILIGNLLEGNSAAPTGGSNAAAWLQAVAALAERVLKLALPFLYGGLGACTALLRACVSLVHERRFDLNRIPEYYSRLVLGFVAGGMIMLFVQDPNATTELSTLGAPALGFLAGYNTNLLFNIVERIAAAILGRFPEGSGAPEQRRQVVDLLTQLRDGQTDAGQRSRVDEILKRLSS